MRRLFSTAALSLTAALGLLTISSTAAKAECNTFNFGIGGCVNEGPFGGSYGNNRPSFQRFGNDDPQLLLEQPRTQPNFGGGYYGTSWLQGW